jgi:hypothetical protein
MGGKSSRNKGARGEREFIAILQQVVDGVFGSGKVTLKRNLFQTREGGADVAGFPDWLDVYAVEVKRQETLQLRQWWRQTVSQCTRGLQYGILAYRRNGEDWSILVSPPYSYEFDDARKFTVRAFKHWFEMDLTMRKDEHASQITK